MTMYNEIIELLPSIHLKAKIKITNHSFNENELLQIIYSYAPTFDSRISMIERFSRIATEDVSALAKEYIKYERDNFDRFIEGGEEFVYELHIKECPNATEDIYLCSSYESALACIDRYYEKYGFVTETEETRYKITKRKVFSDGDELDEDACAECVLGQKKIVLEVSDFRNLADCDISCHECKKICPRRCEEILFPCFVSNYAIIKYRDYDRRERYGVNLCLSGCRDMTSELYVIPLHSDTIRYRNFTSDFYNHDHVPLPLATLALPEDLDETMRNDYFAFVEFLKSENL